jgi:NADP-dependent 3-hydroxy acid dehydrogenase YdfG
MGNAGAGNLKGRIVIITGASAGIGAAIARELVDHGVRVVVNARREPKLDALVAELNQHQRAGDGPFAIGVAGDAADDQVIAEFFDAAHRSFGREADAVIANAGRGLGGSVLTSDPSQWEEMIRTNLLGASKLLRAAGTRMLSSLDSRGVDAWRTGEPKDIIVIGSIVGRHVSPFSSMYGGTKFGIHGVAEGLRRELAPRGVRVTLVEPGFVESEFQGVAGYKPEWFRGVVEKIGPVLQPEDVARPVAFLLGLPAHVHLSDFILRPTRQDYP